MIIAPRTPISNLYLRPDTVPKAAVAFHLVCRQVLCAQVVNCELSLLPQFEKSQPTKRPVQPKGRHGSLQDRQLLILAGMNCTTVSRKQYNHQRDHYLSTA